LSGKAECSVDEKRRFSFPPRYRTAYALETSEERGHYYPTVVVPWFKGALAIYPKAVWQTIVQGIDLLDYTSEEPDLLEADYTIEDLETAKLICFSRAEPLNTDPEGRLTLTPDHCAWIRIPPGTKGRLAVVGMGRCLHAFNLSEWDGIRSSGANPAAQSAEDQVFYQALRDLLEMGRKARIALKHRSEACFDRKEIPAVGQEGTD